MTTVVFGYSLDSERYSNIAYHLLLEYKHEVIAFNPRNDDIKNINHSFDTLTMYVNKAVSDKFSDDIMNLHFKRIIFNPGAENEDLAKKCSDKNIEVIHGCTLVMLKTNQY